ncbi:MAG: hypothetical protein ABIQ27_06460 [Flavobacterium sp.]|uniref:hypothetical protein n=1 Tax=Flavobacterium sp. TaxID=239 RepID=UPI003266EC64
MKKYFILGTIFILLNACSSDSGNNNGSGLLVKEYTSKTTSYDGFTSTSEIVYKYFYNGNKLATVTYGDSFLPLTTASYTYAGDLITTVKQGSGAIFFSESHYQYDDSGRLIRETTQPINSGISEDLKIYTYNPDNTVIRECYHGLTANPADLYETDRISLDSNNRFIKLEILNGSIWTTKNEATYSIYNSPFKNITGYDKLFILQDLKNGFNTFNQYTNHSTYNYTINNSNYPAKSTHKVITYAGATLSATTDIYKY